MLEKEKWCKSGITLASKSLSLRELYYNAIINNKNGLDCSESFPGTVESVLYTEDGKESESSGLFLRAKTLSLLPEGAVEVEEQFLKRKFKKVLSLVKKTTLKREKGELYQAAVTLGRLFRKTHKGKDKLVVSGLMTLLRDCRKTIGKVRKTDDFETLSRFTRGCLHLSETLKKGLKKEQVGRIANLVIEKTQGKSLGLRDYYHAVDTLDGITKYKFYRVFRVEGMQFSLEDGKTSFQVSDFLGQAFSEELALSVYPVDEKDQFIAEGTPLAVKGDGVYEWAMGGLSKEKERLLVEPGVIVFEVVAKKGGFAEKKFKRKLGNVEVVNFEFLKWESEINPRTAIGDDVGFSVEKRGTRRVYKVPQTVKNFAVKMNLLLVSAGKSGDRKKPFSPDQVFLRLSSEAQEAVWLVEKISDGRHELYFNVEKDKRVKNVDGLYNVELILGDILLEEQKIFQLGKMQFAFKNQYEMSDEEEKYVVLPKIDHLFQEEEKRASTFLSTVFSGIVFVPFVVFLMGLIPFLGKLNLNVSGFLYHVVFQAAIIVACGTIFLFWVKINVFQTFKILGLCLLVGLIFGSKALRKMHKQRTGK